MTKPSYAISQTSVNIVNFGMLICLEGWSPRIDYGDMNKLEANIKAIGVQVPLLVRRSSKGDLEVIHGYRRYKAIEALAEKEIVISVPVVLAKNGDEPRDLLLKIYNTEGLPFKPYEEAEIFARLIAMEWDIPTIAEKTGNTQDYIKDRIMLVKAIPSVIECLRTGTISLAAVQRIIEVGADDQEKQSELLAAELEEKGSTKKEVEVKKEDDKLRRVKLKMDKIKDDSGDKLPLRKAKVLLVEISDAHSEMIQARLPINSSNKYWKRLQSVMLEVRNLKKIGLLRV